MASVHSDAGHLQCSPYRVSGEQFVVRRNSRELHHSELHYHVVDELLSLLLCQDAFLQISLDIDVKECGNTSDTHCSSVLCLDRCKVSEVQPLNSLFCVCRRLGDIIAVRLCHLFHSIERADLISDLFAETEISSLHSVSFILNKVRLFLLDQVIDTVESHTAVVAYDTSSSVCIRKTCDDLVVTRFLHLRSIDIKYCLVVCLMIFCKDFMQFFTRCVSVCRTSLLSHLDSAVRHERSLERFVCLETHHLLQIFHLFIDISRTICCQAGNDLCLHVQNAALGTLLFL